MAKHFAFWGFHLLGLRFEKMFQIWIDIQKHKLEIRGGEQF